MWGCLGIDKRLAWNSACFVIAAAEMGLSDYLKIEEYPPFLESGSKIRRNSGLLRCYLCLGDRDCPLLFSFFKGLLLIGFSLFIILYFFFKINKYKYILKSDFILAFSIKSCCCCLKKKKFPFFLNSS